MPKITHLIYPDAEDIFLDDTNLSFEAENVQEGFENLNSQIAISASPGFTWGRSGVVTAGTYLLNDSVPSNTSGRTIFLYSPQLAYVFVSNELNTTYSLDILEHDKVTYTVVQTVTVVADYSDSFYIFPHVNLTRNKELAVRVSPSTANNPKNVVCGLLLKGTFIL